jgi:hypothetical protein
MVSTSEDPSALADVYAYLVSVRRERIAAVYEEADTPLANVGLMTQPG